MTVYEYYCVFGYLIPIEDYIELVGYNDIDATIIAKYRDEYSYEVSNRHVIMDLMCEGCDEINNGKPHWDETGYTDMKKITVNGVEFIVRTFPHDCKEFDKYYVVGIDQGNIDVYDGDINMHTGADDTGNVQFVTYKLACMGVPYFIVKMITDYMMSSDNLRCRMLLEDPTWKPVVDRGHNAKLFLIPNDCKCCS